MNINLEVALIEITAAIELKVTKKDFEQVIKIVLPQIITILEEWYFANE